MISSECALTRLWRVNPLFACGEGKEYHQGLYLSTARKQKYKRQNTSQTHRATSSLSLNHQCSPVLSVALLWYTHNIDKESSHSCCTLRALPWRETKASAIPHPRQTPRRKEADPERQTEAGLRKRNKVHRQHSVVCVAAGIPHTYSNDTCSLSASGCRRVHFPGSD